MRSIRKYNTNDYWQLCGYEAGLLRERAHRVSQLRQLRRMLVDEEDRWVDALKVDLGKPLIEGYIADIAFTTRLRSPKGSHTGSFKEMFRKASKTRSFSRLTWAQWSRGRSTGASSRND